MLANLPMRAEPGPIDGALPSVLAWLGVAGAAGGFWWWVRAGSRALRRKGSADGQAIVRLSSQALTPHASVHAVRWNGEEYLLACTSQEITLVSRRPTSATEDA
ncbi:MAG TPA: flagellar biosynthetic protein FliO [Ramlibacter sp.]|uniref:flagellar biosynthetic protein FliO n=1 Tax=Ramlibacter sp. TaxID=1917967 RepID=UPI002ED04EC4